MKTRIKQDLKSVETLLRHKGIEPEKLDMEDIINISNLLWSYYRLRNGMPLMEEIGGENADKI